MIAAIGAAFLAVSVARGHVTVGDFVLFTAAVTVVQSRLTALLNLAGKVSVTLGVFKHYLAFTAVTDQAGSGQISHHAVQPLQDAVEFRDVWFRYTPDGDWILRAASFRLAAGQTHALVGPNGAGKSTVVKLLLRLFEPTRGQIIWDGIDIRRLDPIALRRRMSGVLQDHVAYELTAVENITVGDIRYLGDTARGRAAADPAGILSAIDRLPGGMDSMLSTSREDKAERTGTTLSGGQWQRIALARALMRRDADLFVLDEPNAGLDPDAEQQLHTALMGIAPGCTRLLISHRLGALRQADQIVVLKAGAVLETGSHDELMTINGEYARLFRLQASGYLESVERQ